MPSVKHSPAASSPPSRRSLHLSTPNTPATQLQQQLQLQGQGPHGTQDDAHMTDEDSTTVPFPAPQIFDILPPLHALLSRLVSNNPDKTAQQQPNGSALGGQTLSGEAVVGGGGGGGGGAGVSFLDPKVLLTEASAIKIRVQKARVAVAELPDVDRTVDEQLHEIEELEAKIEKLKAVVGEFGQRSTKAMKEGEIS